MTINCKGRLIDFETPKIMGILNLTPNSFYDGGKFKSEAEILNHVEKMISDGADFIDIGAYSSKPNVEIITQSAELQRLIPTLERIIKRFPETLFSIDTFRSQVAKAAIESGAALINDISAGSLDPDMLELISTAKVPYIMMHMRGNPQTMQQMTDYTDMLADILLYFSEKVSHARRLGINDLIIDPGFGFAKTMSQNYELLQKLELLHMLKLPIVVGISRKSMVYKPLKSSAKDALNGTTALHMIALMKGANLLRVHDVKEAVECVKLFQLATGDAL